MRPRLAPARARLVGMLLLGIAVVLLFSSPTWFASGQEGVGLAQVLVGFLLAGAGVWFYRGSTRAG